jgi:hypothetical protein
MYNPQIFTTFTIEWDNFIRHWQTDGTAARVRNAHAIPLNVQSDTVIPGRCTTTAFQGRFHQFWVI